MSGVKRYGNLSYEIYAGANPLTGHREVCFWVRRWADSKKFNGEGLYLSRSYRTTRGARLSLKRYLTNLRDEINEALKEI